MALSKVKVQREFQNVQVFGIESNGLYLTLSKPPPKQSITGKKSVPAGSWLHKDSPPVVTADVETARTEVTQGNDLLLRLGKKHKPEIQLLCLCLMKLWTVGVQETVGTAMMLSKNVPLAEARSQVEAATKLCRQMCTRTY
jgi:hypothetical protein